MSGDPPGLVIREGDPDFLARLDEAVARLESSGRIVLCSGCFDLLHAGHLVFLDAASEVGDVVVVAMNSDSSVRALKGPGRPIEPEDHRAGALLALPMVDLVVVCEGRDARTVLRALRPEVFVLGATSEAEYPEEAAEARQLGADVIVVERRGEVSTTRILEEQRGHGGAERAESEGVGDVERLHGR
jgi:rfaE bifunctional protein nucleotidyltransferase chain/domain